MTDRERLAAILADMSPELFAEQVPHCRDYWLGRADRALAAGVTLPEPHAPAAPPKPTWEPSEEAWRLIHQWRRIPVSSNSFLLHLYAQLHRDRVAALTRPWPDRPDFVRWDAGGEDHVGLHRRYLLALADDGTGT